MLKKFFAYVPLLVLTPKLLVLLGYSFSRLWSLASIVLFLIFLEPEQYALVIVVSALFGIFVNPVAEAMGHLNLRIFPSEVSIVQNVTFFIGLFTIVVCYYVFIAEGGVLDEGIAPLTMFLLCSFFGIMAIEFRHILKLRKEFGLMVLLYNIILPISTTISIIVIMKLPGNNLSPELSIFGALLFCHSVLFVSIAGLKNTGGIALSKGFIPLIKYTAITFSSGQMTNVFILMIAGIASDKQLVEISILLKLSKLIVAPNLVNSQVSLTNFRHLMVSGKKFNRYREFYRHRSFSTLISSGISIIVSAFIFFEQQIFSLDFGFSPLVAVGLLFASNVFIVWAGPLSGLMIAHGREGLATFLNIARISPFVVSSGLYTDPTIAMIIFAIINIVFVFFCKMVSKQFLEN